MNFVLQCISCFMTPFGQTRLSCSYLYTVDTTSMVCKRKEIDRRIRAHTAGILGNIFLVASNVPFTRPRDFLNLYSFFIVILFSVDLFVILRICIAVS